MEKKNYIKQWKQSFYEVSDDGLGRSPFRCFAIGICLVLIWLLSALLEVHSFAYRVIRASGVGGVLFVIWALVGPSLEVLIEFVADKKKKG